MVFKKSLKGSIELSLNFLIILIMSIVVFGIGIALLTSIGSKSDELSSQLSVTNENQLKQILDDSEYIAIYPEVLSIDRKNSDIVGLGIKNRLNIGEYSYFAVEFSPSAYISKANDYSDCDNNPPDVCNNMKTWTNIDMFKGVHKINNLESLNVGIPISVSGSAMPGKYIFDVKVCYLSSDSGDIILDNDNVCNGLNPYPELGFLKLTIIVP
jgi:hypothetical protein